MIVHAFVLSTVLSFVTCSPISNKRSRTDKPYGYAPYVWVAVSKCVQESGWCAGRSKGSFALTVDIEDHESGMCTHYCPGDIYATWKSGNDLYDDVTRHEERGIMLGAYVYRLDPKSCVEIPGKFSCSDRVVSSIPINKVSIMLHASEKNRDYFFGDNPEAQCEPGPQCAAYKFLRRTLYAPAENVTWPNTDDVLTIRNSPYDCVLTYAGLGDSETIGLCYTQLGNNCFRYRKTTFCIGDSEDAGSVGLTNADKDASAPIVMCEISNSADLQRREPLSRPTTEEIVSFIGPLSCDATVVSVENVTYNSGRLFVSADIERFHALSELGHVILTMPLDECLLPIAATDEGYASAIQTMAKTLHKTIIATYSSAIMFDASEWGTGACARDTAAADLNTLANNLARAVTGQKRVKMFLRLPRTVDRVKTVDFARLSMFESFVTPRATVDMNEPKDCQNMWAKKGSTKGVMSYLLTVLRAGVKANKLITTLSLTGGVTITPSEANVMNVAKITGDLTLADSESNTMLKCEEDINTKCCSGSTTTIWGRNALVNVTYTTTSLETLKQFPELIASAFGINQFVISPVDSDFKRKVRANTPAIPSITSAVHRLRDWRKQQAAAGLSGADPRVYAPPRSRRSVELITADDVVKPVVGVVYKDPASGSKNVLDPQYQVGLSNKVECPGLIATNGALGVFKEPYIEMLRTAYDKIYIANIHKLASCTPGEPTREAERSETPPDFAINVHTLVPTSDKSHFMLGILNNDKLVQYNPPVNKVCNTHNSGEPTHSMNVVSVDDGYVLDIPKVEAAHGVIVKPAQAFFFVSNFSYGIDYMNLNVQCINYDVSAMQPCLMAICGGDSTCRKDYGKLCNSAHEIVNDARRASEFVKEGLEELAAQETKAMMYKLPENTEFAWMDEKNQQKGPGRKKRFLGLVSGVSGLAVAWHTSNRVDKLEEQMDAMKENYMQVTGQLVEVNNRLDHNIALVNGRMDEHEQQMKRNADFVNKNFAVIKDSLNRNTEMLMRDINTKFSVTTSYQMWYAQMQSVTHQMMQAAMQVRFIARGVENCLRQIASKRSGSCPSGMSVIREHPGLAEFPTVSTALYKDRKLFIVHSLPRNVEKTVVRGIIPMPKMSTDGMPCWPDYKVWLIGGKYYEPSECHGKYCYEPKPHSKYLACLDNPAECKTVCARCHRGVCYEKNKFVWMQSTAVVSIDSPPLKPFSRPHISDGPVTFEDLLKDKLPGVPELEIVKAINTSVKLMSVKDKLQNISDSLEAFDQRYEEISASRVTLGGWFSGFVSDFALWTCVAVLMAWCTGLSAAVVYALFCGGGGGGGGQAPPPVRVKGYRRAKML